MLQHANVPISNEKSVRLVPLSFCCFLLTQDVDYFDINVCSNSGETSTKSCIFLKTSLIGIASLKISCRLFV